MQGVIPRQECAAVSKKFVSPQRGAGAQYLARNRCFERHSIKIRSRKKPDQHFPCAIHSPKFKAHCHKSIMLPDSFTLEEGDQPHYTGQNVRRPEAFGPKRATPTALQRSETLPTVGCLLGVRSGLGLQGHTLLIVLTVLIVQTVRQGSALAFSEASDFINYSILFTMIRTKKNCFSDEWIEGTLDEQGSRWRQVCNEEYVKRRWHSNDIGQFLS